MPRNSSGTYTLPAGNPVSPNTLIETNWANPTLADVASSLTDSLDRLGRGTMLAPLKLFDGTALAPALSFNSETSTGLFRPVAGALGVSISGSEVARFTATALELFGGLTVAGAVTLAGASLFSPGPVGIGPATGLTTLTAPLMVTANAAPFTGAIPSGTAVHAVGADASPSRVALDGVGSLTVFHGRRANGTLAAPAAVPADASLVAFAGGGFNGAAWTTNLDGGMFVRAAELWTGTANGTYLMFATQLNGTAGAAVERMRLTDTGFLGVGAAPVSLLHVYGSNAVATFESPGVSSVGLQLRTNGSDRWRFLVPSASGDLVIAQGSATEVVRVDTAGNVGIGIPPQVRLHASAATAEIMRLQTTDPGGLLHFTFYDPVGVKGYIGYPVGGTQNMAVSNLRIGDLLFITNGAERMRIDTQGNIGLSTSPSAWSGGLSGGAIEWRLGSWIAANNAVPALAYGTNSYFDGGGYRYKANGRALLGSMNAGAGSMDWYYSTAGVAGAPVTLLSAFGYDSVATTFNINPGPGSLRMGGHVTRFEAVVAMPAVTGPGSLTTIAHGGTRVPDYYQFTYRNAVAEFGYTPGQEVLLQTVAGNMTIMFKADATNCYFMAPIAMGVVYVGTGANTLVTLTPANWRLVLHALWL